MEVNLGEGMPSFRLSDRAKQVLREQRIEDSGPGTVLRDFETLLSFVGEGKAKTSGKHTFLPMDKLDELNSRMSRPMVHRLKRPQQRSFPHLHGLYLLLRATGLGVRKIGGLTIDSELLAIWKTLNPTERYFSLLDAWLIQGGPELIGERESGGQGLLDPFVFFWRRLNPGKTEIPPEPTGTKFFGTMDLVLTALAELFGWLRVEYREPRPGDSVRPAAIERLPLGDAMADAINIFFLSALFRAESEEARAASPLLPLFQPNFPDFQRVLSAPARPFRDGEYTWRVSLGDVWREIVAPARATLDQLATAILKAFEFDRDHLYCFYVKDPRGKNLEFLCPFQDEGLPTTDEVALGDLPVAEGDEMGFLYDYGDEWRFSVKLLRVGPPSNRRELEVMARQGDAPAQYGD